MIGLVVVVVLLLLMVVVFTPPPFSPSQFIIAGSKPLFRYCQYGECGQMMFFSLSWAKDSSLQACPCASGNSLLPWLFWCLPPSLINNSPSFHWSQNYQHKRQDLPGA